MTPLALSSPTLLSHQSPNNEFLCFWVGLLIFRLLSLILHFVTRCTSQVSPTPLLPHPLCHVFRSIADGGLAAVFLIVIRRSNQALDDDRV
ncbi:hypothetical protein V8C43DRAFT_267086 [Trichoderma afarasin]